MRLKALYFAALAATTVAVTGSLLPSPRPIESAPIVVCTFAAPKFTEGVWPNSIWMKVRTPCLAAGNNPCVGKIVEYHWVWDPLAGNWAPWGPSPKDVLNRVVACGSIDKFDLQVGFNQFPPATMCAVELQYWGWNPARQEYVYIDSSEVIFDTP